MRLIVINAARDPGLERLRRSNPGKVVQRPTIVDAPLAYPSGRRVLPADLLTPSVVNRLEYLVSIGNIKVLEMGARAVPVDFAVVRKRLGHPEKLRGQAQDIVMLDEVNFLDSPPAPMADAAPAVPEAPPEEPAVSAPIPPTERCSSCGFDYPAPVGLHHSVVECEGEQKKRVTFVGRDGKTYTGGTALVGEGAKLHEVIAEPVQQGGDTVVIDDSLEKVLEGMGAEPPAPEVPPTATAETWVTPADLDIVLGVSKAKPMQAALAVFGKSGAGKSKLVLMEELKELFAGNTDPANKFKALALLRGTEA